jgi:uncharacterized protein YkwD
MHRIAAHRLVAPLVLACLAVALPATADAAVTLPKVDAVVHRLLPGASKAPAGATPCANADVVPTASNGAVVRSATLCLLNVERTSRGLRPLRADDQLRKVADNYSGQMVSHGFFAHVGFDGSTLRSRIKGGTRYLTRRVASWSLGENLYWGSGSLATPAQSVDAWMHSAGHRHNVLNKNFRDIGIGIAIGAPQDVGDSPAATYATEFGTRSFH